MKTEKLLHERIDNCPCCGYKIFKTPSIGWRGSFEQEYIFLSGDVIRNVWQRLTEKQKKPNAFGYFCNTGRCISCGECYFAIEFNFINHHEKDIEEIFNTDIGQYLLLNKDLSEPINYVVSQTTFNDIPHDWVMNVIKTPYGNMHIHTIGLMPINRFHENADIFLKLFGDLKRIIISD